MNRQKFLISLAAVFVVWSVLDFFIHEMLLGVLYDSTAYIWRPRPEQMLSMNTLATLLASAAFAGMFSSFIPEKTVKSGLKFGALYGLAMASIMSFGMYAVLPIPFSLCGGWFAGYFAEGIAAGAVVGAVYESKEVA